MYSGCVGDNHLDDTDVDAERYWTGSFIGALPAILDELLAVDMADPLLAEIALESGQCRGLAAAGWFPNGKHIVYMKVNVIAKGCEAGRGRFIRRQALINPCLRLTGPFWALSRR